ncbi:MAG: hypothetical protein K8D98_01020 [Rhodanobacter sp.]|nr:hypothetical protein [Rhodanobacter sp.]
MRKTIDPQQIEALIIQASQAEEAFNKASDDYDLALIAALKAMAPKVEAATWDVEGEYAGHGRVFERPINVTLMFPGDQDDLYLGEQIDSCALIENTSLTDSLGKRDGDGEGASEDEDESAYVARRVLELTGIAPDDQDTFMSLLSDYIWRNKWECRLDFDDEAAPEATPEAAVEA